MDYYSRNMRRNDAQYAYIPSIGPLSRHCRGPSESADRTSQGVNVLTRNMILAVSCALATAMAAPAAMASDSPAVVRVAYGDLNLSSPHDSAVMLRRLHEAALEACGASSFSVPDYRRAIEHTACYRDSMDRAVSAVGAPTVSQLYSGRALASN